MSEFLMTRDAIQCRSHHMKQLRTLRKIRNIIKQTKRTVGEEDYMSMYENTVKDSSIFKKIPSPSTRQKSAKKAGSKTR